MSDQISVSVADEHLQDIDTLAVRLREVGMEIDQVMPSIGVITGAITSDRRSAIAELPGVASVEGQATYQLPPPDADIQ